MDRRFFLSSALLPFFAQLGSAEERRKPAILLRSAWQTVNIGDIGHTPGVVALLEKYLPDVEVRLWPGSIGEGVQAMLAKRFPKLKFAQKPEEVKAAFAECSFLLHGSGPSLVAATQVAEWKEKTGKPYGILGITLSTIDEKALTLLNGASFVYCRDSVSLKLAKDKGVKAPIVEFAPDGAFAADLRNDELALPFLKKHGLEAGKFLCAIPRLRNTPYWKIRKKEMTELDKAKHKENEEFKERDHAPMREALFTFARKTGLKVLVCPEDKSHMEVGKEMFIDHVPKELREKFVWREDYWLTDEALSVYTRSLGLLSMDMHSPIMAVANGIPAIHCRFKQQTSKGQMWKDIGLGDWLFDLDTNLEKNGENITKALLTMTENPIAAKKSVTQAMEFVQAKQKAALQVVGKIV